MKSNKMSKMDKMGQLAHLSTWAAKEFKEAQQGFEVNFEENGLEHLEAGMKYVDEIRTILRQRGKRSHQE